MLCELIHVLLLALAVAMVEAQVDHRITLILLRKEAVLRATARHLGLHQVTAVTVLLLDHLRLVVEEVAQATLPQAGRLALVHLDQAGQAIPHLQGQAVAEVRIQLRVEVALPQAEADPVVHLLVEVEAHQGLHQEVPVDRVVEEDNFQFKS